MVRRDRMRRDDGNMTERRVRMVRRERMREAEVRVIVLYTYQYKAVSNP